MIGLRSTWGGLVMMAACGPVVGTELDGSGGDDGSTGTSGGDDSGPVSVSSAAESGDPSTADDSADESGSDDTDDTGPTAQLLCGATEALQPIGVLLRESTASILLADQSLIALDIDVPVLTGVATPQLEADARGAYVAVTATATEFDDSLEQEGEIALFTSAGAQLWTLSIADGVVSGPYVGADGSIVATRSLEGGTGDAVLFTGAFEPTSMLDVWPRGPRGKDGLVPAQRYPPRGTTIHGWYDPAGASMNAASFDPLASWVQLDDDGTLSYLTNEATPVFVRETPAHADVTPITGLDIVGLTISWSSNASWLLVGAAEGGQWHRVSTKSGIAEPLDLTLPEGVQPLECYSQNPIIDGRGRVSIPVRDEAAARIERFDPSTGTWETLGERVTQVDDMSAAIFGDTVVITSAGAGTTFCPPQSFEPAGGELSGSITQIVRPDDGIAQVLPADEAWVSVRPDGICATRVGESLTLLDLQEGIEVDLGATGSVRWWRP